MQLRQRFGNRARSASPQRESFKDIAALIKAGETAKAKGMLQEMLAADPEAAFACFLMGAACARERKTEDAVVWYDKALAINPEMKLALIQKGKALAALKDTSSAAETFETLLEVAPDNQRAMLELGRLALSEGESDKAEAEIRKALAANPQNLPARLMLAKLLGRKGREAEALSLLNETIRDNPKVAGAHQAMGAIHEKLGRFEEAREAYQRASELAKEPAGALFSLGNIHFLMRDFEAAEKIFRDLLATKERSKKTLYRLTETLAMLGRDEEAIHMLQQDIRTSRRKTMAHGILGMIYTRQQRYDLALAEFRAHARQVPSLAEKLPRLNDNLSQPSEVRALAEAAAQAMNARMFSQRHLQSDDTARQKLNPRLLDALRRRRLSRLREGGRAGGGKN